MNNSLRDFVAEYLSVCAGATAFVVLIAFLSIPYSLRAHPGELPRVENIVVRHLS